MSAPAWAGQTAEPFAVVELFGSEGCSSCPPADDVLRALAVRARTRGERIFTLDFHVDYWDELGWKDPFASPQFTQRQNSYAKALDISTVYTPQMIINGTAAFTGSNAKLAGEYIGRALKSPALNSIDLAVKEAGPWQVDISYQCASPLSAAVLNFALVERNVESKVTEGENAGRTLRHDNVVRELQTVPFTQKEGAVRFKRPADRLRRFSVVVYMQDTRDMKVLAADSIDLPEKK